MKTVKQVHTFFSDVFCFAKSSKKCLRITIQTAVCILLFLVSLVTFLHLTSELWENELTQFDVQFSHAVYDLRTPAMDSFMLFVSSIGIGPVVLIVGIISLILFIKKHTKEVFLFLSTLGVGAFLNIVLKILIRRDRPAFNPLILEKSYSFPSGHAMNSFIFFALFSYFSLHFFRSKKLTIVITIFSTLGILLIGYSRIYLGVHYFTDIIAGYLAGFWWFITVLLIDRALVFYKLFKKAD